MITAVDTNILLDLLIPRSADGERSEGALHAASTAGALVIATPVAAELGAFFTEVDDLERFLDATNLHVDVLGLPALHAAGQSWKTYSRQRGATTCSRCGTVQKSRCSDCGQPIRVRQHILTDFLIGAHALTQADQLLTRDRGYYQTYFGGLRMADGRGAARTRGAVALEAEVKEASWASAGGTLSVSSRGVPTRRPTPRPFAS